MHHFTGSTLEAQIQNIILLKHHFFSTIFRLRRPSFYWGIIFVVKVRLKKQGFRGLNEVFGTIFA